jgi:hypothetical protein
MPRAKPSRRAPGSTRKAPARRADPETSVPEAPRDSRSTPGRKADGRVVHDGGATRRRGLGAGPAVTPTAVPQTRFENDTDAPDADLWR